MNEKRQHSSLLIIVALYVLLSFISNYWLLGKIFQGRVYIYGPLPIQTFYPFNPFYAWNEFLGTTTTLVMPSHLISNIDFLSPNIAWAFHEIILPIVGGIFMYFLARKCITILATNKEKNLAILVPILVGALYELILLSNGTDFWIMGFLAIVPSIPLFSMITIEELEKQNWKKACVFGLLMTLFLSALDDWRVQLAGILLAIIFTLGMTRFSSLIKILREKSFLAIAVVSGSTWSVLWLFPHLYSIYIYSLSHARTVTLAVIVGNYDLLSTFGLSTTNNILYFVYLVLVCISFSSLLLLRKKFTFMSGVIIISIILITWNQSPLKGIQDFLTSLSFNGIDFGVLFRTAKIFTTIALPLTFSLLGLSLYKIIGYLSTRRTKLFVVSLLILLAVSMTAQITLGNNSRQVSIIPQEYLKIEGWLKDKQDLYRTLWLPRTGRYPPGENPTWLKTEGWGAPETSLEIRNYYFYGKPLEYMYPFLMRSMEKNQTRSAAFILSYIGVKYLAIHDDYAWETLSGSANQTIANLDSSPYFRLRTHTEHIYLYENLEAQYPRISTSSIIVDGGLGTASQLIEVSNITNDYAIFFSDLLLPSEIINSTEIFVTQSPENLKYDLLTNMLWEEGKKDYISILTQSTNGIEQGEWHPFYVDNPHHAEWEVFYTWNFYNASFENSFEFDWGFVGSTNQGEKLNVPFKIDKTGEYILLARYLESDKGGDIELSVGNKSFDINTIGSKNAFQWFSINVNLSKGTQLSSIKNAAGLNAINAIILMPEDEYVKYNEKLDNILKTKEIITLSENLTIIDFAAVKEKISLYELVRENDKYFVRFHVDQPTSVFMTIPEQYHGGWVGIVNGDKTLNSLPHFFVNDFWINPNETGDYEIELKFFPEDVWMGLYIINAVIVIIILVTSAWYLIYLCYKRKKPT